MIIECTAWKGFDKQFKLIEKIGNLENKYRVIVVIPRNLEKYYSKIDKGHLVIYDELTLKLKNDLNYD